MQISITTIFAYRENVGSTVSSAASSAGLDYSPVYETTVGKQCDWVTLVQVRHRIWMMYSFHIHDRSNLCYSDSRARACASIHFAGILPAHIH